MPDRNPLTVQQPRTDPLELEHRLTTIEVTMANGFDRLKDDGASAVTQLAAQIANSRQQTHAEIEAAAKAITDRQDVANGRTNALEATVAVLKDWQKIKSTQPVSDRETVVFVVRWKHIAAAGAGLIAMIPVVAKLVEFVGATF